MMTKATQPSTNIVHTQIYTLQRVVQKNRKFEMLMGYPIKMCDHIREGHTLIFNIFEKRSEVALQRKKYVFLVIF